MITKTIGSGGDYADIGSAWAWLVTQGTLTDDYTFTIVSDFTENTGVAGANYSVFNGNTVKFVNGGSFVITNNGKGYAFRSNSTGLDNKFIAENLIFKQTMSVTSGLLIGCSPRVSNQFMSVEYKNLTLIGSKNTTSGGLNTAIALYFNGNLISVVNCRIYNFTQGIYTYSYSTSLQSILHAVENCSVYKCSTGITLHYGATASAAYRYVNWRNTVSFGCLVADWAMGGFGDGTHHRITNCADSDNSIASTGAVLSGNITGIVDGDFLSIDPDSADFLKIDSTSALYKTGTSDISAWNTADAWGNARPDIYGDVSIGAHEPVLVWPKGTMKFVAGSTEISVNLPRYGYESEVVMPITTTEKHPSGYGMFDRDSTAASDYRVLSTATWQLPIAQKSALNVFFRSATLGRCETVTMRLGPDASGFFPFGPDKGDKGDFTVRILSQNQGGMLFSPWRYFSDDLAFVLVSAPAYSLPTQVDQGSFEIGTVDGLLFTQNGFSPKTKHNFRTDLSRTGVPHSIDGNESGDGYETEFDQQCNQSKAAALVAFLTGATGRASDITINAQDYYYAFGFDNGSSGAYSAKFLGSERRGRSIVIKVRHEKYNQFTIPLSFWMNGYSTTRYQDTDAAATVWQDTDGAETILQDNTI